MPVTYLFEVRQIQSFIFATNKLRDATGASELINTIAVDDGGKSSMPEGIAPSVWESLGLQPEVHRATGGVVEITCRDEDLAQLTLFRAAFRLRLATELPGLTWSDGVGQAASIERSKSAARQAAAGGRVQSDIWPMISPMVRPAPRSGGIPAVAKSLTSKGRCLMTKEYADLPTLVKRHNSKRTALASRFLPPGLDETYHWPVEFADQKEDEPDANKTFPFPQAGLRRIALLHADGNGMGALFQKASERMHGSTEIRELSRAIAEATRSAVQHAIGRIVLPAASRDKVLPCRPILLGGDDVTLILRADLALAFARTFLAEFEARTREALTSFGLADGLTAKMGIVFLAPNQPFGSAHRLCESLASSAKDKHRSRIAFWRLTTSAIPHSVDEIDAMTTGPSGVRLRKRAHDPDELAALEHLAELLKRDEIGSGALRRVPELLRSDRTAAERVYARALTSLARKVAQVPAGKETSYDALCCATAALGLPISSPVDSETYSPLWEAHELAQIGRLAAEVTERSGEI